MPQDPRPAGAQTPTPQDVGNAPAAAGMMTPQSPQGETEAAKLDVYHATKLLMRACGKFGPSEDGDYVLKTMASLIKHFGDHEDVSEEFSPAELKRMLATLAGPGAAGPGAPQTPSPGGGGAPAPPGRPQ